jgi:hypothetical protein
MNRQATNRPGEVWVDATRRRVRFATVHGTTRVALISGVSKSQKLVVHRSLSR